MAIENRAETFTGQGSQRVGMWVDLMRSPAARQIFQTTDEIVGFSLSKLCSEGPLEELTKTSNAQPAIVAHSLAALAATYEVYSRLQSTLPKYCLGHSVGEYSALAAAGAITIEDATYLVRQRGLLMEKLSPEGRMVAVVGFEGPEQVLAICQETGTEVANFNSPKQLVISGGVREMQAAVRKAQERSIKTVPLEVLHPFHSSLMRPVEEEFGKILAEVMFKDIRIPVVSNVTAQFLISGAAIKDCLTRQITAPVKWQESIAGVLAQGVNTFIEFGPNSVLSGLLKRIDSTARGICIKDYAAVQALSC